VQLRILLVYSAKGSLLPTFIVQTVPGMVRTKPPQEGQLAAAEEPPGV
jgi:hypothetical protein